MFQIDCPILSFDYTVPLKQAGWFDVTMMPKRWNPELINLQLYQARLPSSPPPPFKMLVPQDCVGLKNGALDYALSVHFSLNSVLFCLGNDLTNCFPILRIFPATFTRHPALKIWWIYRLSSPISTFFILKGFNIVQLLLFFFLILRASTPFYCTAGSSPIHLKYVLPIYLQN